MIVVLAATSPLCRATGVRRDRSSRAVQAIGVSNGDLHDPV
jgi:hypothetical protein